MTTINGKGVVDGANRLRWERECRSPRGADGGGGGRPDRGRIRPGSERPLEHPGAGRIVVRVDVDPAQAHGNVAAGVALVSEARVALRSILDQLEPGAPEPTRGGWHAARPPMPRRPSWVARGQGCQPRWRACGVGDVGHRRQRDGAVQRPARVTPPPGGGRIPVPLWIWNPRVRIAGRDRRQARAARSPRRRGPRRRRIMFLRRAGHGGGLGVGAARCRVTQRRRRRDPARDGGAGHRPVAVDLGHWTSRRRHRALGWSRVRTRWPR